MAQTIADPSTSTYSKVLDDADQLHRLLEEEGLKDDARQRAINDPNFRAELVRFWNGAPAPSLASVTPEQAAAIMGQGFIGIEPLQRHLGVKLSPKSKKLFDRVPFSAEVLQQCAETHVLVACGALSLMDVWQVQTDLLYAKSDPWYKGERFATTRVKAGWQLVRKNPVPDSTSKTWDEQNALLGQNDQVPSASVLAQAILLTYLETKERLFKTIYVRTSDLDSDGLRVCLGLFDSQGLHVYYSWGSRQDSNIGLASSRKFS